METINVNLENLSEDEREQLMKLVEKSNEIDSDNPKKGKKYYHIDCDGEVINFIWGNYERDDGIYAIGNVFKTKEEAEFEVERLKVIAEMKRIAGKDEIYYNKKHYFIVYNFTNKNIWIDCWYNSKSNDIYFATQERADECIDTIGEKRIKKYYLGVKD